MKNGRADDLAVTGEEAVGVLRPKATTDFSKYFNIVREFAVADFRLKYHQSMLGYFWLMLNPILMFGVFYLVFTYVFKLQISNFALYLLIGVIFFNFFQDCTYSSMLSLSNKAAIIKKIYFPRSLIVFASTGTSLLSLAINTVVLVLILLFTGHLKLLAFLSIFSIVCFAVFTMGVSLVLATLFVFFRDIAQIWAVLLTVFFWVTPIVYDVSNLPEATQQLVYFNPLTRFFVLLRWFLLYDYVPNVQFFIVTAGYAVLMFVIGYVIFRKYESSFPENL